MDMTINQAAAIFNEVAAQATGRKDLGKVDSNTFVSLAETVLKTGVDPVIGAISQVMHKTLFDDRIYNGKFKGLRETYEAYGNHVRILTVLDQDGMNNSAYLNTSADPAPMDQWTYRPNKVLQTNYYGQNTYQDYISIDIMQFNTAFQSLENFRAFISMLFTNFRNRIAQRKEAMARALLCNMIAAKYVADTDNVYSLLSEYYLATGKYLVTDQDDQRYYANPSNYPDFCKWASAFIQTLSDRFTERTIKNHMNVTINHVIFNIERFTPKSEQHLYLYSPEINQVGTRVLSDVFNGEFIKKIGDFERVNFWQSYDSPMEIDVKPAYIGADGVQVENPDETHVYNVFGILFDTNALGIANEYEDIRATGVEASRLFYNQHYHLNQSYRCDLTQNCAVFLLHQHLPDPSYMHVSPDELTIAPGASGTVNVTYPQSTVTATVDATALADGVTASYSNGKVTIAVAGTTTVESATVTITDGTTTVAVDVTIAASEAKSRKK